MFAPDLRLRVTLPAKKRQLRTLPTPEQVIRALQGTSVELPALLALWLSLRMSEVRGLRYGDISGDILTIRRTVLHVGDHEEVREQTKTFTSTRRLRLPPYLRQLIGKGKPDEPIIKESGAVIYNRFVAAIAAAGLPHMRFHDLRHPYVKHTTKKYNSEKQKTQATKMDLIAWGFCFCIVSYSKRSWTL